MVLVDNSLKTKKEFRNLKETGDTKYFYKNESGKGCFQHDWLMRFSKNNRWR